MSGFVCRQGQWPAPSSVAHWWQPWSAAAAAELLEVARLGAGELEHLTQDPMPAPSPAPAEIPRNHRRSMLAAVSRWWRTRAKSRSELFELEATGRDEVKRIAKDLRLSGPELGLLISRGPGRADLLHRRLAILKLDPNALADAEPLLFRDLQRLCALCDSRRRCVRDLARDSRRDPAEAAAQGWRDYCPNAATLNMLSALEICSPAQR